MNVLLVMPRMARGGHEDTPASNWYVPAYGIMYVSAYLKQSGFRVETLNLNHYGRDKLDAVLRRGRFDAVCTGGLFTYMSEFDTILRLARHYNPGVKTVLGGPVATAHPAFAMNALKPDFLVIGEGEETTAELLHAVQNDTSMAEVRGIAYAEDDRFVQTPTRPPIAELNQLPFPDYDGFEFGYYLDHFPKYSIDNASYLFPDFRSGGIIGGRDCPGKCTFCFRITGGKLRVRSVDNIVSEIRFLMETYGVNDIAMMDDVFAIKKSRVYEFCDAVKPMNITWTCQLRVPGVHEELLKTMKAAGCYLVSYGFESASPTVLKSMKKGITVGQIENVIEPTKNAKMTLQANFIFGDPAETMETAKETLAFARRHKWLHLGLNFIKPFPGSDLYHDLVEKGRIKNLHHFWVNSAYDEDGSLINMTALDDDAMRRLRAMVYVERMHKNYFTVTHRCKTAQGRHRLDVTCPVCGKTSVNIEVLGPGLLACPNCYMRAFLDTMDFTEMHPIRKRLIRFGRHAVIMVAKKILDHDVVGPAAIRLYHRFKKRRRAFNFSKLHVRI